MSIGTTIIFTDCYTRFCKMVQQGILLTSLPVYLISIIKDNKAKNMMLKWIFFFFCHPFVHRQKKKTVQHLHHVILNLSYWGHPIRTEMTDIWIMSHYPNCKLMDWWACTHMLQPQQIFPLVQVYNTHHIWRFCNTEGSHRRGFKLHNTKPIQFYL